MMLRSYSFVGVEAPRGKEDMARKIMDLLDITEENLSEIVPTEDFLRGAESGSVITESTAMDLFNVLNALIGPTRVSLETADSDITFDPFTLQMVTSRGRSDFFYEDFPIDRYGYTPDESRDFSELTLDDILDGMRETFERGDEDFLFGDFDSPFESTFTAVPIRMEKPLRRTVRTLLNSNDDNIIALVQEKLPGYAA